MSLVLISSASTSRECEQNIGLRPFHVDYPTPLTAVQRAAFQRHVAKQIHRYSVIHRTTDVVRRGLKSVEHIVQNLEDERSVLQKFLNSGNDNGQTLLSLTPAPDILHEKVVEDTHSTREQLSSEVQLNMKTAKHIATSGMERTTVASPSRRLGTLQRSTMFAGMQCALKNACKQATQSYFCIGHVRERISKQTRLSLVLEGLSQEKTIQSRLQAKLEHCSALEQVANQEASTLLTLLDEMLDMETIYPGSFSLRATVTECIEEENNHPTPVFLLNVFASCYSIPFIPSRYSTQMEDMQRCRIEDVLEQYLNYRARIDPILQHLNDKQNTRLARRVDHLMDVIGLSSSQDVDCVASCLPDTLRVSSLAAGTLINKKQQGDRSEGHPYGRVNDADGCGPISVYEEDDDVNYITVDKHDEKYFSGNKANDSTMGSNVCERALIQSALNALDDFEDMY